MFVAKETYSGNGDYSKSSHSDFLSVIKLAGNLVFHAHSKHIETHHHFVREKMLSRDIVLQKIRTDKQVADFITKTLARAMFEEFREALGVIDNKLELREAVKNWCNIIAIEWSRYYHYFRSQLD
ncbi:UNVERIFIED_CONTAM: hypothetical protein Sangu_2615300 [Sesamum angustifolium]|uniref:Uncharacterized protein n=1 Tax=Sesamum angustifolium TaxID=2727405 RepID=A0AAW2J4T4_9LAMI